MGASGSVVPAPRYRWVVLAVGTTAQATVAAAALSVAILAPELREQFALTIAETGVVLAAFALGMTPTLLAWGLLADRIGERVVLPLGLMGSAVALTGIGLADGYAQLALLLVAAGALAASVNAASGRAVMNWFDRDERGLALGIRQASVPLGGLAAALVLPPLAGTSDVAPAYLALAGACAAGALAGAVLLRDAPHGHGHDPRAHVPARPLRESALWLVSWGSALIVVGQIATMSFTVLFLNDGRGFSTGAAALVLAAQQVLGGALRIVTGHRSDRFGSRIVPLSRLALAVTATLVLVALFADAPSYVLVPVLVVAGGIGLSWNGLSFVAAAEVAGAHASGAAIGFQQTVLGVAGIAAPIGIAALVSASSWRLAFLVSALFPLLGWAVIRPLGKERTAGKGR